LASKKTALLFILLTGLFALALVRTATASIETCHVESSDSYGAPKNTFYPNENVYVKGSGFPTFSTTFDIYVVNHKATWNDGDSIPPRVAGTATTVPGSSGNIPLTIVWQSPLTPGKYDIVIDVDGNGKYNKNVDCLDTNDCKVTAGFVVLPEYVLGTILGLAGCMAAFGVFRMFKSKDKTNRPR
jgi:hypothetical protein